MILVLAAYFGMAYYLIERIILTAKSFEEESKMEEKFNIYESSKIDLNISVETNNVLYQEFISVINKNELDKTKKILVCCTGDYQSMALLTIAVQIFGIENVQVFFYNYDETFIIQKFLMKICFHNNLIFHCIENNNDSRINRYNRIDTLCKENDISYVFEGHTIINHSNEILSSIFSNSAKETYPITTYKPFINIDNITLFKFFSTYDIKIDNEFTHLEHTRLQYKTVFEDVELTISNYYSNWRMNIMEHLDNVDFNKDLTILRGKNGFKLSIDLNTISYYSFSKSLNKIFNEFDFYNDDLEEYYNSDDDEMFFISKEYQDKINNFINYLDNNDLDILVDELLEKQSQSSFEDIEQSIKESSEEDNDESNSSIFDSENDESNETDESYESEGLDGEQYIIKVDLSARTPVMKLVNEITNYSEDYLNGIIYINVWNNTYFIYESNTNNNIDSVHDDKKNQ